MVHLLDYILICLYEKCIYFSVFARMTFPNNFKHENDPPLLPIGALDMQNSLEYGEEEYELSDFIYAVKSNLADKVAVILGESYDKNMFLGLLALDK